MEPIPITATITNKATELFGLTTESSLISFLDFGQIKHIPAQIRESHPTATNETRILLKHAMWWVNKRSMTGPVIIAATMPLKSKQAPISPLTFAEYPIGC
jgi:hypothetical protein